MPSWVWVSYFRKMSNHKCKAKHHGSRIRVCISPTMHIFHQWPLHLQATVNKEWSGAEDDSQPIIPPAQASSGRTPSWSINVQQQNHKLLTCLFSCGPRSEIAATTSTYKARRCPCVFTSVSDPTHGLSYPKPTPQCSQQAHSLHVAILCVAGACVLVRLGTGRTGAIKIWTTMQRFSPPRRCRVRVMPGQYVCVWVVNCLNVRMWSEGHQWEEFISILVVTYLCSEMSMWNKEKTHRGALLSKKPSDILSCSVCWWPKPAKLPLLRTYQAIWETLHLPFYEPFRSSSAIRCCHPRCFSHCLKNTFAEIWFSDFSSHPKWAQTVDDSLPPCSSCRCAQGWPAVSSLDISEQPRFFQPVLRWSHFEEDPAKLHRERDANKKTHQNTASISNTKSSPPICVFLGTEGPWYNSPRDWGMGGVPRTAQIH